MSEIQKPTDRLNYVGELEPVLDDVCAAYGFGDRITSSVIDAGYEDCNVVVETERGMYLAKMFAAFRSPENIEHYVTTMRKVIAAGVNHPLLAKSKSFEIIYHKSGISMVLMDFVEGQTFYKMDKRAPDEAELHAVLEQAAIVNRMDYHPSFSDDSWAVPYIHTMFSRVKRYIKPEYTPAVEEVIAGYNEIPLQELPYCFVHGDFVKTNVLKGADGKTYILDFSVSNWYPRIQELAVIVANLMYDSHQNQSIEEKTEQVADMYHMLNPLSADEQKHLLAYSRAVVAMEFMGAHQEKYINGNDTEETAYWLQLGRAGLGIIK